MTGAAPLPTEQRRLVSLDVMRGLTVAVMILVNNAGDGAVSYAQLRHSAWNGCTVTDVVFPWFLFIVGASTVLSFGGKLARGASRSTIAMQVLRRALLIFIIGLTINALPSFHLSQLRIFGVLQRIALCYALVGLMYLYGRAKFCVFAVPVLLAGYGYLLLHVRVPGLGLPGIDIPVLDPYANLPAWLDRHLLPAAHLYHHSTYDPEGLLSTLGALATTLMGLATMLWLKSAQPSRRKAFLLALAGVLAVNGGLWWSHSLALNKRLFTPSFALVTGGLAMVVLALLYLLIDHSRRTSVQPRGGLMPWLVFGTNALFAYILSEVLAIVLGAVSAGRGFDLQQRLYHLLPSAIGPPPFVSMIYSVLFVGVCFVPTWLLYRRRIFLKL